MNYSKILISSITLLSCILIFSSCEKYHKITIGTDKTEYISGEKIVFYNSSGKTHSYQWSMPGGQKSFEFIATYTVPSSQGFSVLEFKFDTYNRRQKIIASKTITIETIPESTASISTGGIGLMGTINAQHASKFIVNNQLNLVVQTDAIESGFTKYKKEIAIKFNGTQMPAIGTYIIKADPVQVNECRVLLTYNLWMGPTNALGENGELIVDSINGKMHIKFVDADAGGGKIISGEIYWPSSI